MDKEIKLSFHGDMYSILPRKLWQVLYNIYSEASCDLTNLDNLLIDYDNCKDLFNQLERGQEAVFTFGCEPKHWMTTWIPENQFWDDYDSMIELSNYDVIYKVQVNENGATFTRHK